MAAHEHSDTVRSLSPAANGSTDDVPVPKGLPPPAPPNGLEDEGLPPKGDAELLPLTSPNGLPPHLITDACLPYGRRDVAEMDHDVGTACAIVRYPVVLSDDFFWH